MATAYNENNRRAYKIHFILFNVFNKLIRKSIENKIKQQQNCSCSNSPINNNKCQCIFQFLSSAPTPLYKPYKNHLKKLISNKVNSLESLDLTACISLSRNLLSIDPLSLNGTWKNIENLNEMLNDLSFDGCLNNLRNIRNKYYGHLTEYEIDQLDYDKILNIFKQIVINFPGLEDTYRQECMKQIDEIIQGVNITDQNIDYYRNIWMNDKNDTLIEIIKEYLIKFFPILILFILFTTKNNDSSNKLLLKSDNISFIMNQNYMQRNEIEIRDMLIDQPIINDYKSIFILYEIGGMGKTTMTQFITKDLRDNYNYVIKWFQQNNIDFEYDKILKNEFNLSVNKLDERINLMNLELRDLNNKIVFVFDNIANNDEIFKYLVDLPRHVQVVITTRNEKLLNNWLNVKRIQLRPFDMQQIRLCFTKNDEIMNQFGVKNIDLIVNELFSNSNKFITPHKLQLAINFILNNLNKNTKWIVEQINKVSNEEEFVYLVIQSIQNESNLINELLFILSFLDTSFISYETIENILWPSNEIPENVNTILDILFRNGLISILRVNDVPGIKVHDIIVDTINNKLKYDDKQESLRLITSICVKFNRYIKSFDYDNRSKIIDANYIHILKLISNDLITQTKNNEAVKLIDLFWNYVYFYRYDYNLSIHLMKKNILILNHLNESEPTKAIAFHFIGLGLTKLNKHNESLAYLFNSLNIFQSYDYLIEYKASVLNSIGLVYSNMNELNMSFDYFNQSFEIKRTIFEPDDMEIASILNNIGDVTLKLKHYQTSFSFLQSAHEIQWSNVNDESFKTKTLTEKLRILEDTAITALNFGCLNLHLNNTEMSIQLFEKVLQIFDENFIHYQLNYDKKAETLFYMGQSYFKLNDYEKSLNYLNESLEVYKMVHKYQPNHSDIANVMSEIGLVYFEMNNFFYSHYFCSKSIEMLKLNLIDKSHPDLVKGLNCAQLVENRFKKIAIIFILMFIVLILTYLLYIIR